MIEIETEDQKREIWFDRCQKALGNRDVLRKNYIQHNSWATFKTYKKNRNKHSKIGRDSKENLKSLLFTW